MSQIGAFHLSVEEVLMIDAAGQTIGQLEEHLSKLPGLSAEELSNLPWVDGKIVAEQYVLQPGDSVCFRDVWAGFGVK